MAYVEQHLVARKAGDLVVMGNLPSHKVAGVAEAVRGVGADGEPATVQSRISTRSSRCLRRPRPRSANRSRGHRPDRGAVRRGLGLVLADVCKNYIRHAGYGPQRSD